MTSKTARKVLGFIAATALTLGLSTPAFAANPADLLAPVAGSYAKMTDVEVGVFDGTGVLIATCYTDTAVVKNGEVDLSCGFSGDLSGAELVMIDANEGSEAYSVSKVASSALTLKNLSIGGTGWFSVDLGGSVPEI